MPGKKASSIRCAPDKTDRHGGNWPPGLQNWHPHRKAEDPEDHLHSHVNFRSGHDLKGSAVRSRNCTHASFTCRYLCPGQLPATTCWECYASGTCLVEVSWNHSKSVRQVRHVSQCILCSMLRPADACMMAASITTAHKPSRAWNRKAMVSVSPPACAQLPQGAEMLYARQPIALASPS